MGQRELVLASGSPRRREILAQVGIRFRVVTSGVPEEIPAAAPEKVAAGLARQKAEAVAALPEAQGCVVLGADTVVVCDGEILGKPKGREEASRMIRKLQGRRHEVFTGAALVADGECRVFAERTVVTVSPMAAEEIAAYVDTPEPYDKAGGYGIQGQFARYIERIEGDYYNVMGLPVCRICRELKELGCNQ